MLSTAAYGREKSLRVRQPKIGIGEIEERPGIEEDRHEEPGTSERTVYEIEALNLDDCCVVM